MCDCNNCENFKQKKRDPQVGDMVKSLKYPQYGVGAVLEDRIYHSFVDGSRFHSPMLFIHWEKCDNPRITCAESAELEVI